MLHLAAPNATPTLPRMAEPEQPASAAADNPEKLASGAADIGFGRDSDGRLVMRLQIVRGSFLTAEEDCPMDAAVWSKMRKTSSG